MAPGAAAAEAAGAEAATGGASPGAAAAAAVVPGAAATGAVAAVAGGVGAAATPAPGCAAASRSAFRMSPAFSSTRRWSGLPPTNSALTRKLTTASSSGGGNRHVLSAASSAPAHGSAPSVIRATPMRPSGSSVTSAAAAPPPSGAPAGHAGVVPWRNSGTPASRATFGSASANVIGTVRRTATALPSTFTGSYSHCRAAAIAASSSPGTLRMREVDSTLPVVPTTTSRITIPRMPWASASAG